MARLAVKLLGAAMLTARPGVRRCIYIVDTGWRLLALLIRCSCMALACFAVVVRPCWRWLGVVI